MQDYTEIQSVGRKAKLHVGYRHGKLEIIAVSGRDGDGSVMWLCRCDCGAEKELPTCRVQKDKSCGCLRKSCRSVKPGDRFNRLVAIEPAGFVKTGRNGQHLFKFKCDCGGIKIARVWNVVSGTTGSCGCLQRESAVRQGMRTRHRYGTSALHTLYYRLKTLAEIRNKSFSLTEEQVEEVLSGKSCVYCGAPPRPIVVKRGYGAFFGHGLDRIDSSIGYEPGNVIAACRVCNQAKNTMNTDQFKVWIIRVFKHLNLSV